MSLSDTISSVIDAAQYHWPNILSGISITTGLASTIYGIAVTPRAMDRFLEWIMENTTEEDRRGLKLHELHRLIPFKIKVQLAWRLYLPVLLGSATSVGTGIAADVTHGNRELAYAALATAAQTRLNDIVESTKEVVGKKKYDEIEAAAAQKEIDRLPEPIRDENVYYVNRKTEGFPVIDNFTGRVYILDRDHLDKIQDRLNARIVIDDITLNDVYREMNNGSTTIPLLKGGENLLYTIANGKLTFVDDMDGGWYEGRPAAVLNLLHNLCIRYERDYIKLDKYA